jgi:hypothetical protein
MSVAGRSPIRFGDCCTCKRGSPSQYCSLNVSAQVALPEWVRGRGLAMFVTVFFGALSLGSAIWGQIAGMVGLPAAHFMAAAGALVAIPMTWHWKLQTGPGNGRRLIY